MHTVLTFIIPARHQENSRDWASLKKNLADTVRSIASQDSHDWKAVIVANHGADPPELPSGFEVKRVRFSPNPLHERGGADDQSFYESFRIDKGRRVLAGMLHAGEMGHVMIVDEDDLVSNRLASLVARNRAENGWYIKYGYVWGGLLP